MLTEILKKLFTRDLKRLKSEITAYQNENALWVIDNGISNSGGNLCLHLIGNLNAFIGVELGKTDYVRQRDLEFSQKNVPRQELISQIDKTIITVQQVLEHLTQKELESEYPEIVFKEKMTTAYFLTHLATHLTYHLGQISYHRRLLDS